MEKQLIALVRNLQNKVEDLSGMWGGSQHINEFALLELSNSNKEFLEDTQELFNSIKSITYAMSESKLFMKVMDDPRYTKRQVETRQMKMKSNRHLLCSCGEYIHKDFMDDHKKRDKHIQSVIRISYENDKYPIYEKITLPRLMLINSHINSSNCQIKETYGFKFNCFISLIRKYKYNKKMLWNPIMIEPEEISGYNFGGINEGEVY